jgi:hypothetical protein
VAATKERVQVFAVGAYRSHGDQHLVEHGQCDGEVVPETVRHGVHSLRAVDRREVDERVGEHRAAAVVADVERWTVRDLVDPTDLSPVVAAERLVDERRHPFDPAFVALVESVGVEIESAHDAASLYCVQLLP